MDRRLILALVLTAIVIIGTNVLFPSADTRPNVASRMEDSVRETVTRYPASKNTREDPESLKSSDSLHGTSSSVTVEQIGKANYGESDSGVYDTTSLITPVARYAFTSRGAVPFQVGLLGYRTQGGHGLRPVELVPPGQRLLRYEIISGRDTLHLDRLNFRVEQSGSQGRVQTLRYTASDAKRQIDLRYSADPDSSYRVRVQGSVRGLDAESSFLLVTIPEELPSAETDTVDDHNHLAFAVKPEREAAKSIEFKKLAPGDRRFEAGPLTWVAGKNKYFVVGLLAPDGGDSFREFSAIGMAQPSKIPTRARGTVVAELKQGLFAFDMYAGPQEWRRLRALKRDFDTVNPYGGWFQSIVQPFATLVMRVLLWMRDWTKLSYGWVLVIFGFTVRLLLWPLNQSAMRSSLKMQRIQPELQEAQTRYRNDQARQQQEIMKIYREHNMSPFSTFTGCLPMLIPMPILLALFFVFGNTIEFRGVPFLWLADISLKDPLYILPVVMGATMFGLSWLGTRNVPPNPQAKMMGYMLPAMMTFFFLNVASGLNLYYAVQNLATIPQQWLIARERSKATQKGNESISKNASTTARTT